MARERYIPEDNQWIAFGEFRQSEISEAIYDDLGVRFPITWDGDRVVIDFDNLPDGLSENDVKQAVRDHHPHR